MATTTARPVRKLKKVNINDTKVGDVFSELSHYTLESKKLGVLTLKHHASGQNVELGNAYVEQYLCPADQWIDGEEIEVGKEDKLWTAKQIAEAVGKNEFSGTDVPREGDVRVPGIRTIWENIHSQHVFTVCYQKQGKALSGKALAEKMSTQASAAIDAIQKAATAKKGVAAAALVEIEKIQKNPVLPFEDGEMRVLVGYKIQFTSRDGRYDCIDMKLPENDNIRPVNINTISYLVYDGKKYIVK